MQLFPNLAETEDSLQGVKEQSVDDVLNSQANDADLVLTEEAPMASRARRRGNLPLPPASVTLRGRRRLEEPNPTEVVKNDGSDDDVLAQLMGEAQPAAIPVSGETQPTSMWRNTSELNNVPAAPTKSVPAPKRQSARRVKTKILDFKDETVAPRSVVDETAPAATAPSITFPVGWLILIEGPGRGECFTLKSGVSQIGRDAQETVSIDFGDLSISRKNHASVAYDPDDHCFYVGHGGKANIVRLNGKPVLSTEQIKDGDILKIGETSLRLKTLCDEAFNWSGEILSAASLLTE